MTNKILATTTGTIGTVLIITTLPTGAAAIPPGGPIPNPCGATVTITPNPVPPGGTFTYNGSGFTPGEAVAVKINDGQILIGYSDVWGNKTATASGTISGTISLANASATTPVTNGENWLRMLSGNGCQLTGLKPQRSLVAEFIVGFPSDEGNSDAPQPSDNPNNAPATDTGAPKQPQQSGTPPQSQTPAADGRSVNLTLRTATARVSRRGTAAVRITAGAGGGSGTVTVMTTRRFRLGDKGRSVRRQIFRTASYYVKPATTTTVRLRLSAAGRKILAREKGLTTTVVLRDATGARVTAAVRILAPAKIAANNRR